MIVAISVTALALIAARRWLRERKEEREMAKRFVPRAAAPTAHPYIIQQWERYDKIMADPTAIFKPPKPEGRRP